MVFGIDTIITKHEEYLIEAGVLSGIKKANSKKHAKIWIIRKTSADPVNHYSFHRWTSKPTEYYSVNSKRTCKPLELRTIMKECNGTGLVLKRCETKNNVWKRCGLSIQ